MNEGRVVESTGWCAPSDFVKNMNGELALALDLPELRVVRGDIDFNAPPAPPMPPPPVVDHEHVWGRENRQGPCDCGQCRISDPRGLDCDSCQARLNPGDDDFDALYEVAPWWWDIP